jgi:hypothetical protein
MVGIHTNKVSAFASERGNHKRKKKFKEEVLSTRAGP